MKIRDLISIIVGAVAMIILCYSMFRNIMYNDQPSNLMVLVFVSLMFSFYDTKKWEQ